jgi:hypothetical protein
MNKRRQTISHRGTEAQRQAGFALTMVDGGF